MYAVPSIPVCSLVWRPGVGQGANWSRSCRAAAGEGEEDQCNNGMSDALHDGQIQMRRVAGLAEGHEKRRLVLQKHMEEQHELPMS